MINKGSGEGNRVPTPAVLARERAIRLMPPGQHNPGRLHCVACQEPNPRRLSQVQRGWASVRLSSHLPSIPDTVQLSCREVGYSTQGADGSSAVPQALWPESGIQPQCQPGVAQPQWQTLGRQSPLFPVVLEGLHEQLGVEVREGHCQLREQHGQRPGNVWGAVTPR